MAQSTTENTTTTTMTSTSQISEHAVCDIVKQQIAVAKTVLLQAVDLVDNHLTSDEQLTVNSKHLPGSTIGKHLRHARDHFVLLIECMQSPSPRVLSYDTRIRNTPMENSIDGARSALLDAVKQLEEVVPAVNFDEEISLHAITPYMHSFKTTIGRELWFASLHCVHHWSMVRVIAGELGIQLAEDFGFAPSTLVYQDREAPLGKNKL
ncbi:FK506-binding protein 5 [Psilocybe cubensis]|uniref:DinB-like domain-containing protein n=2 Tax=Psilocybe cubensis TaxID=181762 RepID=A0A8H7Y8U3_PSICU|nr:FK506-binding protein 5 [Psilocybe cubensis]KAH9487116.1 FK506-binding protein 5 [Psilocybe cubensis]